MICFVRTSSENWSNGNLVTNFSREKFLDVIYKKINRKKIIAKEPTEVVKWVYFSRKTVERLSIDIMEDPQKLR